MFSTPVHFLLQIGMVLANLTKWATGNFLKCTILLPAILAFVFIISSTLNSKSESHWVVSDSLWPHGLYSLWNSPGQNTVPFPGHLPNPGIEPRSPALQADSLPAEPPGKPTLKGVNYNLARVSTTNWHLPSTSIGLKHVLLIFDNPERSSGWRA